MKTPFAVTVLFAVITLLIHHPNDALSENRHVDLQGDADRVWVDFNEDGYADFVVTDPETGRLSWFMSRDGDWHEVSEIEAVDPWRQARPAPRSSIMRLLSTTGDDPRLFAYTTSNGIRIVDTETGFSAYLGSIGSFLRYISPNAMTSSSDSVLTVLGGLPYEAHLYDFHPVSGNLLADHKIVLPEKLVPRGMAALDENTFYALRYVKGDWNRNFNELWLLRPLSGTAELIGPTGDNFHMSQSLAFSPDGGLYGWAGPHNALIRIDTATGIAEIVGDPILPRLDIQALAFGPDGTLYGGRDNFYRIDTATGRGELIGPTSHLTLNQGVDLRGLAFAHADLQAVGFGLRSGHCPARFTERTRGRMRGFITGSEDLDVSRIETTSVRLAGDLPVEDFRIIDIAMAPESLGDCTRKGADGFPDLVFFFDCDLMQDLLWPTPVGDVDQLQVSARTVDGAILLGSVAITPDADDDLNKSGPTYPTSAGLNAFPNPFNPRTTFSFSLESPGNVSLLIYDFRGRLIRTLAQGFYSAGGHQEIWNGRDNRGAEVSSGSYRALLRTPDGRRSIAVMLLR